MHGWHRPATAIPRAINSLVLTSRAPSFISVWKKGLKALPMSGAIALVAFISAGQFS